LARTKTQTSTKEKGEKTEVTPETKPQVKQGIWHHRRQQKPTAPFPYKTAIVRFQNVKEN